MNIRHQALGLIIMACSASSAATLTTQEANFRAVIQAFCTKTVTLDALTRLSPEALSALRGMAMNEIADLRIGKDSLELVENPESAPRAFSALFRIGQYFNVFELIATPAFWALTSEDFFTNTFQGINIPRKLFMNALLGIGCWYAANKLAKRHENLHLAPRRFALIIQLQGLVDYIDSMSTPELPA